MASGCPVITDRTVVGQEVIGSACLVDSMDTTAIEHAMEDLATSADLRKELRLRSLGLIRSYSWTQIARRYLELYQDVVN